MTDLQPDTFGGGVTAPIGAQSLPNFERPLHVGQPNMGDRATFYHYLERMFSNEWYTNDGPLVREFETAIAGHLGVKHCVAMSNGTTALEIAIRALGLTGEVIIPSYTFIATAHALSWQGITPVFADIDPLTHNLDPSAVRRMISSRTTGIIGVHLWGRPAPVAELAAITREYGLELLFDAAHAFGCTLGGTRIGNFGRAEVFSFHATKFFNSFEGGAVVTNDDDLAQTARLMRNFGFAGTDNVIHPGTNAKMTEPCAAMGLTNLLHLPAVLAANRRNYLAYQDALSVVPGLRVLPYPEDESSNYQYVVVEVSPDCPVTRDELVDHLRTVNVLARKYFWPGCHRMQPYSALIPNAGVLLPNTERIAEQILLLPTGTHVTLGDVAGVVRFIESLIRE